MSAFASKMNYCSIAGIGDGYCSTLAVVSHHCQNHGCLSCYWHPGHRLLDPPDDRSRKNVRRMKTGDGCGSHLLRDLKAPDCHCCSIKTHSLRCCFGSLSSVIERRRWLSTARPHREVLSRHAALKALLAGSKTGMRSSWSCWLRQSIPQH